MFTDASLACLLGLPLWLASLACLFGLPPWQIRTVWLFDNIRMCVYRIRPSQSAALVCVHSGNFQGMSLTAPQAALCGWKFISGKVQYSLSPSLVEVTMQVHPHMTSFAQRERERERVLRLSSHTRLIQVLPGHPLADPQRRNSMHQHNEGQAYESIDT